jgi:glycosyltransferase involved in cell wall biosynthesis
MKPSISVIIPGFNARTWLGQALESAIDQRLAGVEIIYVDDESTDGSADYVAAEFPAVRIARTPHGGPSRARNVGTRLATGEFIQYLDADDLLAPRKLEIQLDALTQSGADVAYGNWRELPGRLVARQIGGNPEIALFTDFWCPPAAYLFRRPLVERIGGWNESLPVIQDARFVLDCALHGGRFVYCASLAAYYRIHSTGSVSTRDPSAFTRDCLHNATGVESWWASRGGLSRERHAALLKVYGQVARASFGTDPATFETAVAALERLQPGYAPASPRHLALASRLVGYRRAEAVALRYRRAKHAVKRLRR